jgi:tetratricopeptide (TPR) repeat protein
MKGASVGTVTFVAALFFAGGPRTSFAQEVHSNPREQPQQSVAQLQQSPNDNDLREKIIKLVLTIKPAPAIPEDARKHFVIATTLAKDAKSASDFQSAVDEYQKALLVAPWWGKAYWDLAIALQGAEKYDDAKQAVHLFLDTNPKPDDARAAQDRLYVIEAKAKEKENQAVAQQQTPQPAAPKQLEGDELIDSLDGAIFIYRAEPEQTGGCQRQLVSRIMILHHQAKWGNSEALSSLSVEKGIWGSPGHQTPQRWACSAASKKQPNTCSLCSASRQPGKRLR